MGIAEESTKMSRRLEGSKADPASNGCQGEPKRDDFELVKFTSDQVLKEKKQLRS